MRILLFGKNGQLGWELHRSLITLGELTVLDHPEVDFNKPETLAEIVHAARPDVIVNAVAYTNVDKAESEPDIARRVNADAVGEIAREAKRLGALLVHYSTDYVFDGSKGSPYVETDTPNPINVYGRTKLAGEEAAAEAGKYLVLRTSWMYGRRQHNFAVSVLGWVRQYKVVRIVDDHIGSPTWARSLSDLTGQLLAKLDFYDITEIQGIYHLAGEGSASRYEFAEFLLKCDPYPDQWVMTELKTASSNEFTNAALRPINTSLDINHFSDGYGLRLPFWKDSVRLMMQIQ
jgi:dTDP-4-dehydrorhamnose reductase